MLGSILVGKKPLVTVSRETPVSHIIALLHEHRIGAVLVLDGEAIAGLVSERDIVRCMHTHGKGVHDATAADMMSAPVVTVDARMSVCDAMAIMTDRRFRHLPVLDHGQLIGLVSIGDLVKRRIEDAEAEAESLKHYIAS
ncbi:CBS domain-containing protein [Sandarakinorhabdus sp. AAP62]|uniref:CBS domain-containing protein n=1 Tax=Sandarakinorhabdus sp. AAP62 TaxID=1248916 RepID=UPI00030BADBE|nr:CBS domain-containing protein [Sandarakinorhabdus sp. AAP62]